MDTLIFTIKVLISVFVTIVWTVVGFLFWIPMLFRVTAVFAAAVVIAALRDENPAAAAAALEDAIRFYPAGFVSIQSTLFGTLDRSRRNSSFDPSDSKDWSQLVIELLPVLGHAVFTTAFWVAVIWFFR